MTSCCSIGSCSTSSVLLFSMMLPQIILDTPCLPAQNYVPHTLLNSEAGRRSSSLDSSFNIWFSRIKSILHFASCKSLSSRNSPVWSNHVTWHIEVVIQEDFSHNTHTQFALILNSKHYWILAGKKIKKHKNLLTQLHDMNSTGFQRTFNGFKSY
jgi:hypothetical protein